MYICLCKAVTENAVRQACEAGATTLADLQSQLGVATGCGQCAQAACELINSHATAVPPSASNRQYKNAALDSQPPAL